MSITILRIAAALYAAGAAAYILYFARPIHQKAVRYGFWLVAVGFLVHGASIGAACKEYGGTEFFNLRGGFGLLGWVGAGAFLLLQRVYPIPAVGAFILPLVLMAVLPGFFGLGPHAHGQLPNVIGKPALTVHISTALGGIALFLIAFGVALM